MDEESAPAVPHRSEAGPWQPSLSAVAAGTRSGPGGVGGAWFLPTHWLGEPLAIYVTGTPRPAVNRVVFAMSRSLDPAPLWVEIVDDEQEPDAVRQGWVPPERAFLSRRTDDLETSRAVANLALWGIVRSDEPSRLLTELTDFVRLPPLIQEVLGQSAEGSARRAIAVGNADRVQHLFRERIDDLRWLLTYLKGSMASLIVGITGRSGRQGSVFDAEFRVEGAVEDPWTEATLTCEREGTSVGFPVGRRQRLSAIPELRNILGPLA